MKLIIMAAALTLGGAAVAQTTDMTTSAVPAGGQAVAPDNSAPERDARGIAVISAPATAPAGYNMGAQTVAAGTAPPAVAAPTPTASGPLPPCTRTVTDRCTQTYERGRTR
jgi:cytoskeletal protein RodZ